MKVLSLFDGISCGMVALERAGIPVENYDAFEIDEYAVKVSKNNYPNIVRHGDVFKGDFTQFKGYDLLLGGSPCTYWSTVKKNREITPDGEGGKLFMQYVRALKESECKYFLYENNDSIHKNIKAFISEQLGVEPIMINSALVSGQTRPRCYWTNIPNVTQPEDKGIMCKDILEKRGAANDEPIILNNWNGKSRTIKASYMNTSIANGTRSDGFGTTMVVESPENRRDREIVYHVENKSITYKGKHYTIDLPNGNYLIRKLTPVETERLQTLPDNYTAGLSNTRRYKCIGNGWTVDVISHILKNLKKQEEKSQ